MDPFLLAIACYFGMTFLLYKLFSWYKKKKALSNTPDNRIRSETVLIDEDELECGYTSN